MPPAPICAVWAAQACCWAAPLGRLLLGVGLLPGAVDGRVDPVAVAPGLLGPRLGLGALAHPPPCMNCRGVCPGAVMPGMPAALGSTPGLFQPVAPRASSFWKAMAGLAARS